MGGRLGGGGGCRRRGLGAVAGARARILGGFGRGRGSTGGGIICRVIICPGGRALTSSY
jgi:hypothetical protein